MEKLFSINELIEEYEHMRRTLPHLSELGELSEATVRYYQQKGLFRPAGSSGKEARYSENTLWRIIFTRILQLRSAQVLHRKTTLPEIANILQGLDPDIVERIAKGEEELSIGIMPDQGEWQDYSPHPDIELKIGRELTRKQAKQVRMAAELLASVLDD